ncbi:hypothetical protein N7467_002452 [Penicillium canescens]|nr:hypothetical protein N7467_002452 [Penicillium canescens]
MNILDIRTSMGIQAIAREVDLFHSYRLDLRSGIWFTKKWYANLRTGGRLSKWMSFTVQVEFYLAVAMREPVAKLRHLKRRAKAGPEPPVSGGKCISVYDFFQQTYNITIKDTNLPVINVGFRDEIETGSDPENDQACSAQTCSKCSNYCHIWARDTGNCETLGIGCEDLNLRTFGLDLVPKLISAGPGRDTRRDDAALKPTIDTLTKTLRETGINAVNCIRGQHTVVNDVERGIDTAIHTFTCSPSPPTFILVILPAADSGIYNQVKYVCDVKESLLNMCVVANKFAKPNSDQNFANVALKFNPKLGGRNQFLESSKLRLLSEGKIMVVGIDVTHPSPGSSSQAPSVAGIAASADRNLAPWLVGLKIQTDRQEMMTDLDNMLKPRLNLWMNRNGWLCALIQTPTKLAPFLC